VIGGRKPRRAKRNAWLCGHFAPGLSRAVRAATLIESSAEHWNRRWTKHVNGTAQNRRDIIQPGPEPGARRVPPPLRLGAALVYVLSRHKAGPRRRFCEVGFSPHRPTNQRSVWLCAVRQSAWKASFSLSKPDSLPKPVSYPAHYAAHAGARRKS